MISRNSAREVTPRGRKPTSIASKPDRGSRRAKRNETKRNETKRKSLLKMGDHVAWAVPRSPPERSRVQFKVNIYQLVEYVDLIRIGALANNRFNDRGPCADHVAQQ